MEIAGIDQRLIGWQSTRRQQIEEALFVLTAEYVEEHGHEPGERAAYALACRAADRTRPPKRKERRPLFELRESWRESAIASFRADVVDRLAERARAAAAAVWARVRPVVDVALAAVDVVAVVYVMRGAFKRHHLLAEARRYVSYVLRGRPHQPGLDERIVQTVVDDYTRPVGRGLMMTADLHALYPRDTDDQAVLRPLTRQRTLPLYARARLAAGALSSRVHAARRAERLGSRARPHTVAVPGASRSGLRPSRTDRKAGRAQEQQQGTDRCRRAGADPRHDRGRRHDGRQAPGHSPGARRRPRRGPRSPAAARPADARTVTHPAARRAADAWPDTHWRTRMTTPETPEIPGLKDVLARARAASGEIAAALDEDQEPEPEEPVGWQPIWKRPRTPKSKAAKKKQLHDQRERLQDAAKRRHRGGRAVPDRRGRAHIRADGWSGAAVPDRRPRRRSTGGGPCSPPRRSSGHRHSPPLPPRRGTGWSVGPRRVRT